ncbi:YHS domain-containing (seleno)protein [Amylibacter sp. IMCC11727]|uniref:YHS domain-containing (seleno)protein n=1 Tax=Amylibacter sp. IMCC11727 TaxID=3039851 RepID=UPI00244E37B1|nr:YHS domain-containing (seleno)protein [Amylibacter sp. IMCC11727]WGI23242.1 YHS domain-containing (seleno)protein [Amylibacter sp. IMCC11727]
MKRLLPLAFAALTLPTLAFAGPQYVDETGFAVSGHDVVAYFTLEQNAVGQAQPAPVKGKSSITAEYNGATWAFSSEANRDAFVANPEAYIPQYNGHCAYGVSKGGKVPANPELWRIVDGKLYLNVTKDVVGFWEEDISGNLKISEAKWPKLEPRDASTRTIPFYSSNAPITN